jgi:hypothetical protein
VIFVCDRTGIVTSAVGHQRCQKPRLTPTQLGAGTGVAGNDDCNAEFRAGLCKIEHPFTAEPGETKHTTRTFLMMVTAYQTCLDYACECVRLASFSDDPDIQANLLEMARNWLQQAQQVRSDGTALLKAG